MALTPTQELSFHSLARPFSRLAAFDSSALPCLATLTDVIPFYISPSFCFPICVFLTPFIQAPASGLCIPSLHLPCHLSSDKRARTVSRASRQALPLKPTPLGTLAGVRVA